MRAAALILAGVCSLDAQFKATSTLVLAPTTVTTAKGKFVDGPRPADLILFDNNVPQPIQVEEAFNPLSLIVLVQASSNSPAILDKLGGLGVLFAYVVAGHRGETALITFSDETRVRRDFTSDPDKLAAALRNIHAQGNAVATLDAVQEAMRVFARRPGENRRVLLVIAEKHDRSSSLKLAEIVRAAERQNILIYWLTYSPFLTAFTARPKGGPPEMVPGSFLSAFGEIRHDLKGDAADELTRATGGRALGFLRKDGLEEAVQEIGREVHRQYIVSFQPASGEPGRYHAIRISVKDRPELIVRTRSGYWSVP